MAFSARIASGNSTSFTLIGVDAPQCTHARLNLIQEIVHALVSSAPRDCPLVIVGDFYSVESPGDISPASSILPTEPISVLSSFSIALRLMHSSLQRYTVCYRCPPCKARSCRAYLHPIDVRLVYTIATVHAPRPVASMLSSTKLVLTIAFPSLSAVRVCPTQP